MTAILLQQLGNAANRVPPAATAFANRDARWDGLLLTSWEDAAQDAIQIEWTREAWRSLRPFSTGGVYVNGVADGDGIAQCSTRIGCSCLDFRPMFAL